MQLVDWFGTNTHDVPAGRLGSKHAWRTPQNMSYDDANSAVYGRKVILVFFVIFELGSDSESLWNALHLKQSGVGSRHFFTLKIDSEALGTKKKSLWCLNSGMGEK